MESKMTKAMVAQKLAQAQLQEAALKGRQDYLGKMCTVILTQLDLLCQNELDKVEVVTSLTGFIAARCNGPLDELQKIVANAYEQQKKKVLEIAAAQAQTQQPLPVQEAPLIVQPG